MARGQKAPEGAINKLLAGYKNAYGNGFSFSSSTENPRNSAFDIDPAITQIIQEQIQAHSVFMDQSVDSEIVEALAGEYDRIGVAGQLLSTVITDRYGFDPTDGGVQPYQLEEVTSDTAITYSQMARWNHKPLFLAIANSVMSKARADSYERVGWWGQTRIANRTASQEPLGKQIATGWLQWLINNAPEQVVGINLAAGDSGSVVAYRDDYTVGAVKIGYEAFDNGTASDYTTTNAGFAIGVTSLPLITGTGTIPEGQVITIAGDATATKYTVTAGISAPGTITIFPALQGTLSAATHAITLVAPDSVIYNGIKSRYNNLDLLITDGIQKLIPVQFQDNLSVVVGRGIYNYLTMGLLQAVDGNLDRLPSERIQVANLRANLNIGGYPVVVSDFAPAYMIAVTRLKGSSAANTMLGNSNLVKLTHAMTQKNVLNLPFKSAIIDFMYENLFFGLRNEDAMFFIHPDSVQFWTGTTNKWQYPTTTAFKL